MGKGDGAGRTTRRARAACALAMLALASGGCAALDAGTALRTGWGAVVGAHDTDGDGGLDRDEVSALVARALPEPGWASVRRLIVGAYMAADANGDGHVTAGEIAAAGGRP